MTPSEFTAARKAHGSQRTVATRLGIGFRTLQRIEDGTMGDPIPAKYELMLKGLSA
jgi:transcriptional regulator with XRE-family HTH domain